MDTRTLLEQDQERFLTRLAQADTPERTVTEIEEELNRILLQYNETCTDERMREAAVRRHIVGGIVAPRLPDRQSRGRACGQRRRDPGL